MAKAGDASAGGPGAVYVDDGTCFGCGRDNPIGMRLRFDEVDDGVRAEFTPGQQFQGYVGVVHGGLVATMLDEALAWAVLKRFGAAVTGEFYMRHRHPVPVGESLVISGRVVRRRLSLVEAEAQVADGAGRVLVEGRAKFMLVKQAPDML